MKNILGGMNMSYLSCCGTDCTKCNDYQKNCGGCNETCGKVSWTKYVGIDVCSIYQCAINDKKLQSCGKCDQLPCDKWYATKDPSMTDEEFQSNVETRVQSVKNQ